MIAKIYLNSPSFVQNIFLSIYGYFTYRQRFGGDIPEEYKAVADSENINGQAIRAFQEKKLREIIRYACTYVPYYQKLFAAANVKPEDITLDNYADLVPTLTKRTLLERQEEFYTSEKQSDFIWLNTSGTSGTPLKILTTKTARKINYFLFNQILKSNNSDYRSKSTIFAGRILYSENTKSYDRYDFFNRTQYLSSYFISPQTCASYINALNKWQPEYIDSYPSAIFELQRIAREQNLALSFSPKFILTSSETLSKENRAAIEAFFGCKIIDHYGCTEMAISAHSSGGKYFINPLQSLVEFKKNEEDSYSIVTTGLINFSMPLLRYEIGDNITTDTPDNTHEFDSLVGRIDDVIVTPEGRRIGRMDPAFKGVTGIALAQIEQTAKDQILVRVVLHPQDSDTFDKHKLIANIKERTSPSMQVDILEVANISKGANGKFRSVINSYLKKPTNSAV